jgi:hypothetical protein
MIRLSLARPTQFNLRGTPKKFFIPTETAHAAAMPLNAALLERTVEPCGALRSLVVLWRCRCLLAGLKWDIWQILSQMTQL